MKMVIFVVVLVLIAWVGTVVANGSSGQAAPVDLQRLTTSAGLEELVRKGGDSYLLIDVRTPEEFAGGHIPTAINIPHTEVLERLANGPKERIIIVYCRTGRRSGIARGDLERLGYDRIVDFGGISRWEGAVVRLYPAIR